MTLHDIYSTVTQRTIAAARHSVTATETRIAGTSTLMNSGFVFLRLSEKVHRDT